MNSTTPRPIDSIRPRRGLWRSLTSLLATGAVLALPHVVSAATATIIGLPAVPGGSYSVPKDVSDDGSTVVGYTTSTAAGESLEAFRWKRGVGTVGLGDLPPSNPTNSEFTSFAWRTTGDGSAVVGHSSVTNDDSVAFKWTPVGGLLALGDLPGGDIFSQAKGVSDDGSVVVGYSASALGSEPFRWTAGTGMQPLGTLPGGFHSGIAWDISADGTVIVGQARNSNNITEAFRWTQATGLVGLGDLPGGTFNSRAFAISRNGQWVVGRSVSSNGNTAFIWSQATGMIGLGDLPGGVVEGVFDGNAYSVSDSGVAVGSSETVVGEDFGSAAFIWDAVHGMRNLKEVLESDYYVDMTGWTLESAEGISADGRFITGSGSDPDGNIVPWLVELPRYPALPEPLAFTFETFDAPGGTETLISDIRNDGTLVGRFKDGGGISQGFVQSGTNLMTFNVTGTTATFPGGIDSFGRIAGFYRDASNPEVQHGFIRNTNGVITTIDGPGQTFTYAWRINDAGQVNGYWFEDPFFITSFRRAPNGTLTTNVFAGSPIGTVTRGMNEAGDTAGWKWDENYVLQGVVFAGGATNVFTVAGWQHTLPGDINNLGDIAGTVNNGFTNTAGFFRRADGTTVIFTPPGAVETEVFGMNDLGQVVGEYADAGGNRHGFIAHPAVKLPRGHTDIGIAFEDGAFDLHIHDEETDTEYTPGGAVLCVGEAAELAIPDTAAFSFLGRPGYSTWVLPAVENTNLLFLGFGAEEVESGVFIGDVLRMELASVTGAGDFAVYSFDGFGNPIVHINSADGISAADFFQVVAGGHTDLNWAFSAPGTYRIGFRARGTLVTGNVEVVSDIAYYTFTVPEALLPQPLEPEPELIFNIVNIGTLGGPSSFALDVNEAGQVTGNSRYTTTNTRLHAYLWSENSLLDLGYLTNGVEFSRGYAINDSGFVVGESDNNISKAFLWDGTNMVNIGTLGGASAVAHDINSAGEIVGASSNGSASRPYKRDLFGMMQDLGTLLGTTNSTGRAWGLNEAGAAVGLSRNAANTTSHATLWMGGSISNLGSLAGGTNFSQAYAINDSNVVVGSSVVGKVSPSSSTDLYHAFLWSDGAMVDLGAHPSNTNFIHSEAKDINNAGEAVGYAAKFFGSPTSGGAAMLWKDGVAHDLNHLVPAGSGWVLQSAEGINDRGDIAGHGSYQGQTRAFLLHRATRLSRGHTDIGLAFEDGGWDLHVHSGDLDQEFEPGAALLTLPPLTQTTVPTNASYAFLGAPGSATWILPSTENPKLLFLGFGAEEIESGVFVGNQVTMKLKAVDGPGTFSVFSIDGFGVPVVHMNSGDGISTNDVKSIVTGSHEDFAWGFTRPGYYRVTFEASGTLVAGNEFTSSGDVTYYFEVIGIETQLAIARSGGSATISFVTQDGLTYQLESAPAVTGPWADEGAAFLGTGRMKTITVPLSPGAQFFRMKADN